MLQWNSQVRDGLNLLTVKLFISFVLPSPNAWFFKMWWGWSWTGDWRVVL